MDKKIPGSKLIKIDNNKIFDKDLAQLKTDIDRLKKRRDLLKEYLSLVAEMTRAKYKAMLKQGFTEEQALELSKAVF